MSKLMRFLWDTRYHNKHEKHDPRKNSLNADKIHWHFLPVLPILMLGYILPQLNKTGTEFMLEQNSLRSISKAEAKVVPIKEV